MATTAARQDEILQDPLRGESFRLSTYVQGGTGSTASRQASQFLADNEFTISCTF
jgi:hypothetical protein